MTTAPIPATEPSARVVFDLKIPLWGVISASCAGMALFASLYFSVQALTEAVKDLQITVKTGNTSVMTLQSEQSLLKFRIGTAESDISALKAASTESTKGRK